MTKENGEPAVGTKPIDWLKLPRPKPRHDYFAPVVRKLPTGPGRSLRVVGRMLIGDTVRGQLAWRYLVQPTEALPTLPIAYANWVEEAELLTVDEAKQAFG